MAMDSLEAAADAVAPYHFAEQPLLVRQAQRESNARTYPRRIPIALRRARGVYVEDVEGRTFIDCLAGAGTLALGHNHPVVIDAIRTALDDQVPLHTLDLATPVKDRFVEEVFSLLPGAFAAHAKIQFCGPTGADAIEAALKLVKIATGRSNVLAFHGAYHGMTHGALQLMGNLAPKQGLGAPLTGVQFLPYPYDYRCPFGLGGHAGQEAGLNYLRSVLNDPESGVPKPAALILEAVQGEGGVIPAPDHWLREVRQITRDADVPLIVDEVQSGFGRTGRMFAFEHAGIEPDVVVLSKALGGSLPLAVVIYRDSLDRWAPGAHAGTFRGNQLAMAAGTATLRFIASERLDEHAARMGEQLQEQLRELQRSCPHLGDVRGRGLMVGVEIVDPAGDVGAQAHPPRHGRLAARIQRECLRRGLILECGGRDGSVVRWLPPLIIDSQQLRQVTEIFGAAVRAAVHEGVEL